MEITFRVYFRFWGTERELLKEQLNGQKWREEDKKKTDWIFLNYSLLSWQLKFLLFLQQNSMCGLNSSKKSSFMLLIHRLISHLKATSPIFVLFCALQILSWIWIYYLGKSHSNEETSVNKKGNNTPITPKLSEVIYNCFCQLCQEQWGSFSS